MALAVLAGHVADEDVECVAASRHTVYVQHIACGCGRGEPLLPADASAADGAEGPLLP